MATRAMRIVIQNSQTGLFVEQAGTWTMAADKAFDFGKSTTAIDHCLCHNLTDIEVAFRFRDPRYNFSLQPFAPG